MWVQTPLPGNRRTQEITALDQITKNAARQKTRHRICSREQATVGREAAGGQARRPRQKAELGQHRHQVGKHQRHDWQAWERKEGTRDTTHTQPITHTHTCPEQSWVTRCTNHHRVFFYFFWGGGLLMTQSRQRQPRAQLITTCD